MLSENQRPHACSAFAQKRAAPCHFAPIATGKAREQATIQSERTHPRQAIKEGPRVRIDVQSKRPCAPPANRDDYDGGTQTGSLHCLRAGTLKHPCCCGHKGNHTGKGVGVSPATNRISDNARQGNKQFECHGCHDAPSTMPRANKKAPTRLELETSGWRRRESNPRPLPCDGSALPTELRPQDKCL